MQALRGTYRITPQSHSAAELIRRASYGFEGFLLGGLFAIQKFQIPQKMGSISAGL